jgi:hypothetical protein
MARFLVTRLSAGLKGSELAEKAKDILQMPGIDDNSLLDTVKVAGPHCDGATGWWNPEERLLMSATHGRMDGDSVSCDQDLVVGDMIIGDRLPELNDFLFEAFGSWLLSWRERIVDPVWGQNSIIDADVTCVKGNVELANQALVIVCGRRNVESIHKSILSWWCNVH